MKNYFIRLAESNSFFLGILMAFDVSGAIGTKCSNDASDKSALRVQSILNSVKPIKQESVEDSMRSFFEAVGKDMRSAMRSVDGEK